jgi:predicted dehydrogenase
VTRARQLLDQGLIGDVVSVSARGAPLIGEHLTQHLNQPADMGGALWIIGCHMLDVLLSIYGRPDSVNARVRKYARLSDASSREDAAAVILTYPERQVVFDFDVYDRLEWFESSRVTFHGTGGLLEIGILPQSVRVYLPEARDGWAAGWTTWEASRFTTPFARTEENTFSELPELDNIDFFRPEMRRFVDSIRTGAPIAVPVTDALGVALVVDACYRSEQARGADTPKPIPPPTKGSACGSDSSGSAGSAPSTPTRWSASRRSSRWWSPTSCPTRQSRSSTATRRRVSRASTPWRRCSLPASTE